MWKVRLFIWCISWGRLLYAIKFPLSFAFAASHRFWIILFSFWFVSRYSLISSLIYIFNNFIYLLFFVCAMSSLLRGLFCSCGEQGPLSSFGEWTSHCSGICCRAWAPGCTGFSSCGSWSHRCGSQAPEHRLNSFSAEAQLLCSMCHLPGPGIKPMSPSLTGRILCHWATREAPCVCVFVYPQPCPALWNPWAVTHRLLCPWDFSQQEY